MVQSRISCTDCLPAHPRYSEVADDERLLAKAPFVRRLNTVWRFEQKFGFIAPSSMAGPPNYPHLVAAASTQRDKTFRSRSAAPGQDCVGIRSAGVARRAGGTPVSLPTLNRVCALPAALRFGLDLTHSAMPWLRAFVA